MQENQAILQNPPLSSPVKNIQEIFFSLIIQVDIERLKKIPTFIDIQNIALKNTTEKETFEKVAFQLVRMNNFKAIQFLMENCKFNLITITDENNVTLLHEGCYNGATDVVEYLLQQGANPNAKSSDGRTALHYAAFFKKNKALIPLLKRFNADLDIFDNTGKTPLHTAALYENSDVIGKLGSVGADKSLKYQDCTYIDILKGIRNTSIKAPKLPVLETNMLLTITQTCIALLKPLYFFLTQKDLIVCELLIDTLVNLANLEKNKTPKTSEIYNIAAHLYLKVGAYKKTEEIALKCLSTFSKPKKRDIHEQESAKKTQAHLYFNMGISQINQIKTKEALKSYKEAFNLLNNDNEIFTWYFGLLVNEKNYTQALSVCKLSNCGDLSDVSQLYLKYLTGELSGSDLLKELDANYSDPITQNFVLDAKIHCHIELQNYQKALEISKIKFDRSEEIYQQSGLDISYMLAKQLDTYIDCAEYNDSLIFLNDCIKKYAIEFSYSHLLKSLAATIYLANQLPDKAEALINEIQNQNAFYPALSNLYCELALYNENNPEIVINYLDIALKINPDNIKAKYFKMLTFIITKNTEQLELMTKQLDTQFLDSVYNSIKQANLTKDVEDDTEITEEIDQEEKPDQAIDWEIECEKYDSIKIHEFFQAQKKQILLDINHALLPSHEPKIQWKLKEGVFIEGNKEVAALNSIFYPDHYAVLHPHSELDTKELEVAQMALKKGFCERRKGANGIKIINHSVIELKVNADMRLYATKMYQKNNKYLIVFNTEKVNHMYIKNLVKERKKTLIEIVDLDKLSKENTQFNEYKAKIFDSSAPNNNNNNFLHEPSIIFQDNISSNVINSTSKL